MPESHLLQNIDLVILAGGKGTRIKELLGKYPKPMIKFNKNTSCNIYSTLLVNLILKE